MEYRKLNSEQQIEEWVERAIDRLDQEYMNELIGTIEYQSKMEQININADKMYRELN